MNIFVKNEEGYYSYSSRGAAKIPPTLEECVRTLPFICLGSCHLCLMLYNT
jgi:hypothetical protein